jgi:hypothetical protein
VSKGLKRRGLCAIVFGLASAVVASPAFAKAIEAPACGWQPVVNGLRHLQPPADLAAKELNCGIAVPVDLSPDVSAAVNWIDHSLQASSKDRTENGYRFRARYRLTELLLQKHQRYSGVEVHYPG